MAGADAPMRLVAHRGLPARYPENTLASFRAALKAGAKAVEFDVQQTADRELVVIHDTGLKRLAGVDKKVGELTYARLARLDVGSGERVPRLAEVMKLVGGLPEVHLEIKQPRRPYPGIERRVLRFVKGNVIVSSFDHPTLARIRALSRSARIGWLAGPGSAAREIARALEVGAESIHISLRRVSAGWVRRARASGLRVLVYTPNTKEALRRLGRLGVYGAFTDDAGALR